MGVLIASVQLTVCRPKENTFIGLATGEWTRVPRQSLNALYLNDSHVERRAGAWRDTGFVAVGVIARIPALIPALIPARIPESGCIESRAGAKRQALSRRSWMAADCISSDSPREYVPDRMIIPALISIHESASQRRNCTYRDAAPFEPAHRLGLEPRHRAPHAR
jgi:hypothetical protein